MRIKEHLALDEDAGALLLLLLVIKLMEVGWLQINALLQLAVDGEGCLQPRPS